MDGQVPRAEKAPPDPWKLLIAAQATARALMDLSRDDELCENVKSRVRDIETLLNLMTDGSADFVNKIDIGLRDLYDAGMTVLLPIRGSKVLTVVATEDVPLFAAGKNAPLLGEFAGFEELLDAKDRLIKQYEPSVDTQTIPRQSNVGDGLCLLM